MRHLLTAMLVVSLACDGSPPAVSGAASTHSGVVVSAAATPARDVPPVSTPGPIQADPGPPGCAEPGRCYFIGCGANIGMGELAMLAHRRKCHLSSCICGKLKGDGTRATFDRHLRAAHPAEAEAAIAAAGARGEPTADAVAVVRLVRVGWQGAVVVQRDGSVSADVPGGAKGTVALRRQLTGKCDPALLFDRARLAAVLVAPAQEAAEPDALTDWLTLEASDGWVLREVRCQGGTSPAGAIGELRDAMLAAGMELGLGR